MSCPVEKYQKQKKNYTSDLLIVNEEVLAGQSIRMDENVLFWFIRSQARLICCRYSFFSRR